MAISVSKNGELVEVADVIKFQANAVTTTSTTTTSTTTTTTASLTTTTSSVTTTSTSTVGITTTTPIEPCCPTRFCDGVPVFQGIYNVFGMVFVECAALHEYDENCKCGICIYLRVYEKDICAAYNSSWNGRNTYYHLGGSDCNAF